MRWAVLFVACRASIGAELNADTFEERYLRAFCDRLQECCPWPVAEEYCRYNYGIKREGTFHLDRAKACLAQVNAAMDACALPRMVEFSGWDVCHDVFAYTEVPACGGCDEGSYCDFTQDRCMPIPLAGESCTYYCGNGLLCAGVCIEPLQAGEPCSWSSECAQALRCIRGSCTARKMPGERCETHEECDYTCDALFGVCAAAVAQDHEFCRWF